MRLWAGESFARVWVGDTIFRIDRGRVRVEETVPAVPGAQEVSLDEVIAWSPSGERLDPALAAGARRVLDAVALDDARIAAVLADERGVPRLVVGPPAGPFEVEIALEGPGVDVRVPDRLAGPRRDEPLGGTGPRGARVHASEHGIAVAGASGHVTVVRPDEDTPAFVLRIPGHDEARLDAVPTRAGVLVTELVSGRDATVLHLAPDGRLLGRWLGAGSFPAVLVAGDRVLAFDGDAGALALLSLPALSEIARAPVDAGQLFEAAVRPQGLSVVLAGDRQVYTATIQRASIEIRGPYALVAATRPAVAEKKPRARPMLLVEVSGPPEIGFPTEKQEAEPPWKVAVGDELRLPMRVRSTGGPGTGLAVVLSGPAIELGLLAGVSMRVQDDEVALTREGAVFRGMLPAVPLPRGLTRPSPVKETAEEQALLAPTHLTVAIVVRGVASGSALLSIAITARDGLGIKRMRPFVVS